jgi:acyl carrier protein
MSIEEEIARYISDEIVFESDQTKITIDEDLISSGILDSLALLRLVAFIEKRFSVTIKGDELIPDNFQTINRIKAFLEKKRYYEQNKRLRI